MNSALVVVDAHTGTLTRYEVGGHAPMRSHCASKDEPRTFTTKVVEDFRRFPPGEFSVRGPIPIPGGDDSPGSPAVAARAA